MILVRSIDVPLRTIDGGATWQPLDSLARLKGAIHSLIYSWTGKCVPTLARGSHHLCPIKPPIQPSLLCPSSHVCPLMPALPIDMGPPWTLACSL